uniref:Uncharacterized protein n=1 Tax=Panagrolaimus superbus TaxID=310955 RepID=A0A914Z0H7_9BILA
MNLVKVIINNNDKKAIDGTRKKSIKQTCCSQFFDVKEMSSSFNSRIPIVATRRNRLPSITPSTFSIDESSVEYIDSSSDEEFYPQLNVQKIPQTLNFDEQKDIKANESGEKYSDKKYHGNVFKGFKNMLNKFMYVDVPTTDINKGSDNVDERSVCITWLVGL